MAVRHPIDQVIRIIFLLQRCQRLDRQIIAVAALPVDSLGRAVQRNKYPADPGASQVPQHFDIKSEAAERHIGANAVFPAACDQFAQMRIYQCFAAAEIDLLHLQRPRLPHKSFGGFKIDIAPLTQVAVTLGTMQRTAGGQFDVHHPRPCKSGKLAAGNAALPQIGFQFAGNACRRDCQLKMTDVIKNQGDRIRRRCQPMANPCPFIHRTQLLGFSKGEEFIDSRIATVAQAKIDADFFRDPCRRHIKIENEPADERVQ